MTQARASVSEEPITDQRQLVEYLAKGGKPKSRWRIGTEHEKFVFRLADLRPVPYEGRAGIGVFLEAMTAFGWEPLLEDGRAVALQRGAAAVTLEPSGQVELSGEPLASLHQSCEEVNAHLREVRQIADHLGLGLIGLGFQPLWRRDQMPWMPKARYAIMRRYMPQRGSLGLDMMTRTCGVQVNLDYRDEADMIRKLRVGLALQPVATALFANSPFYEGAPSEYLSYRSLIWTDTDPDRCGMLPFVFDHGMGFERYVEHALDVPMYFIRRQGHYIDASGQSFRDFLAGRLPALPGHLPIMSDWEDHLTTLFSEVRLKQFLEMRGADAGPWGRLCALPAFWVGLLYDEVALDAASDLIADWTQEEREALRTDAPRWGLRTPFRGRTLQEVAREVVGIAEQGLRRRACLNEAGNDETRFLAELREIAESGITPAERLLESWEQRWHHRVEPVFEEYAY
ncbi:MAG: glutamate--cysteine ligase [Nitrococcus sp.]|nr:glutamate--cysteine ligase [Nitrococcus sp.]